MQVSYCYNYYFFEFLRPYFELKIHYNQLLEQQKNKVKSLEKQVSEVKNRYAEALRNLEQISDEIHKVSRILENIIGWCGNFFLKAFIFSP